MNQIENIEQIVKQIKNERAKEWRNKNKEKVKEINRRYWLKQAQKRVHKESEKQN